MYLEDKSINSEIARKIYKVLTEEASAFDNEDHFNSFIYSQGKKPEKYNDFGGCVEYRFGGSLGFGGKFWNANGRFYVSAYIENEGSNESKIIAKVNKLLKPLYVEHLKSKYEEFFTSKESQKEYELIMSRLDVW
jgi:hypothetical protein